MSTAVGDKANARAAEPDEIALLDPDDIRGRAVYDRAGNAIGFVEAVLIDPLEARIRFIQVAAGGFLGFDEDRFLIPVDAITAVGEREICIDHLGHRVAEAET